MDDVEEVQEEEISVLEAKSERKLLTNRQFAPSKNLDKQTTMYDNVPGMRQVKVKTPAMIAKERWVNAVRQIIVRIRLAKGQDPFQIKIDEKLSRKAKSDVHVAFNQTIFANEDEINRKLSYSTLAIGNKLLKMSIPNNNANFSNKCQICRSASNWSIGLDDKMKEKSISKAYVSMIKDAENFIYIENQFFISGNCSKSYVRNDIVETIIKKLIEKICNKEKFIVCIAIPLIPGFSGQADKKSGNLIRKTLGYEYGCLSRGPNSIIERISEFTSTPENYVKLFGFRTHGVMPDGNPVTEIVYIHSKLLIIDDKVALIGSANINDRSMLGSRDSELAVIVEDTCQENGFFNGKSALLPKFSYT